MDRLRRWLLHLCLCGVGFPLAAMGQEELRLKICVPDIAIPPYLLNDPDNLGTGERLVLAASRKVGFATELRRFPLKRCRVLLDSSAVDAIMAAPTASNVAAYRFPMKNDAIDVSRRLARLNLRWVCRPDMVFDWDGNQLTWHAPATVLVGTRSSAGLATSHLKGLGFKVDDAALTAGQLLHKLLAKRVDIAVVLQEELNEAQHKDPALKKLVVLPRPLLTSEFYLTVRGDLSPLMQAKVEALWTAIGQMRELPEYSPDPP